jgi:hypothetical protein
MSEGHSFSLCRNVILLCYSWAFDKFVQAINRIWRLDSPADVNVYAIICDGSIDRKLESNIYEKRDAAELVLDGHLLGENPVEVNLAELLQIAEKEFAAMSDGGTLDERELVKEWPALCTKLSAAARAWPGRGPGLRTQDSGLRTQFAPSDFGLRPSAFSHLPLWRQAFHCSRS